MSRLLLGALLGLSGGAALAVALIEVPVWLQDSDRYEIGDSYLVMVPVFALLGGIVGAAVAARRR